MKLTVTVCTAALCVVVATTDGAFLPISLTPFRDLTAMDGADLAYLRQQYERPKRSGSGDILGGIKSSLGQGIKSKLGMIGKASGHFSSGSSGHHYHDEEYSKPFDIWSVKKSVLYTLLQAVKAIKGGVIAIKGQLIKGGGQLLATKGKIIKGGGEALSNLGKSIATSAFMIVPQAHEEHEEHYEYAQPPSSSSFGHSGPELHHGSSHSGPELHHGSSHSGPELHHGSHSGPELHHGSSHSGPELQHSSAPSGPGPEYGPQGYHKYNSVYDGKHEHHQHDGIVILKKIPGHHLEHAEESKAVEFKPLKEGDEYSSGVKGLMGSVFSASSAKHPQGGYKDQDEAQDIPATSYGVPVGPPVKYLEYFNKPSNTVQLSQQKQQTFVTPTPSADSDVPITYKLEMPKPHNDGPISYRVEVAKNHQHQSDAPIIYKLELPRTPAGAHSNDISHLTKPPSSSGKPHIFIGMDLPVGDYHGGDSISVSPDYLSDVLTPTPYSHQVPSKFFINYPDPTELALRDSLPLGSRHAPRKGPLRMHRPPHHKKPSNFEILRSMGFELRPDRPFKL